MKTNYPLRFLLFLNSFFIFPLSFLIFYFYFIFMLNKLLSSFFQTNFSFRLIKLISFCSSLNREDNLIWKRINPREQEVQYANFKFLKVIMLYVKRGVYPKELVVSGNFKYRLVGIPFLDKLILKDKIDFAKVIVLHDEYSLSKLACLNIDVSDFITPVYGMDFPFLLYKGINLSVCLKREPSWRLLYNTYFPKDYLPNSSGAFIYNRSYLKFVVYKESINLLDPKYWSLNWLGESLVYHILARKLLCARGFQDEEVYNLFHSLAYNFAYLQESYSKTKTVPPFVILINLLAIAHSIHLTIHPLTGLVTHVSYNSSFYNHFISKYKDKYKGSLPLERTDYSCSILKDLVYLKRVDLKKFPYVKPPGF